MAILQRIKGSPGEFFIPALGKKIKIVEWKEDDRYDTVVQASGAITAGTVLNFFRDLTNKDVNDGNFNSAKKLMSNGEEMVLERIGVDVPMCVGNTLVTPADIKRVAFNGYLLLKIDRRDVAEGPLHKFPSGYGLAGSTTENNTGIVSLGVASTASAAKLIREQEISQDTDVAASLQFFNHTWDAGNMPTLVSKVWVRLFLHGLIKAGATKG